VGCLRVNTFLWGITRETMWTASSSIWDSLALWAVSAFGEEAWELLQLWCMLIPITKLDVWSSILPFPIWKHCRKNWQINTEENCRFSVESHFLSSNRQSNKRYFDIYSAQLRHWGFGSHQTRQKCIYSRIFHPWERWWFHSSQTFARALCTIPRRKEDKNNRRVWMGWFRDHNSERP